MEKYLEAERSIVKTYRKDILARFIASIREYDLLKEGDYILSVIDGGRDSFLLAKLFNELVTHHDFKIEVSYMLVSNNLQDIENLKLLNIDAYINEDNNYFKYAKEHNINKIALRGNFDDVIELTLDNILGNGQYKTLLPKYIKEGIEIIHPMYMIRSNDVLRWKNYNELSFNDDLDLTNNTKELIKYLRKEYNSQVEDNIFIASSNVNLNKLLGYKEDDDIHSYLDKYDDTYSE